MNSLVAESAGVAVRSALAETIEAVTLLTAGLPKDEGVSALAVAKQLKLDKSAARRRLVAAAEAGLTKNLEVRHNQPGKWRVTGQRIDPVEILPPPEAIEAALVVAESVPPCHRTENGQAFELLSGDATGGTVVAVATGVEDNEDARVAFEERAAVLQYDGGLSREEAEAQAADEFDGWRDMPDVCRRWKP